MLSLTTANTFETRSSTSLRWALHRKKMAGKGGSVSTSRRFAQKPRCGQRRIGSVRRLAAIQWSVSRAEERGSCLGRVCETNIWSKPGDSRMSRSECSGIAGISPRELREVLLNLT